MPRLNHLRWSSAFLVAAAFAAHASDATHGEHCAAQASQKQDGNARYLRSVHQYPLPEVTLVDQDGRRVPLQAVLPSDTAVALNFVFTTCTTICPVMSATFSTVRAKLGSDVQGLRMVSISIDPAHDRPATLKMYANRFGAPPDWTFYTGSADDIRSVLTAFGAFAGDKANHRPITLLRPANGKDWIRIEGFASADTLAGELRGLRAEK
ncbi:MAG TPA: SCO family protein [Myxococcales bacterium]